METLEICKVGGNIIDNESLCRKFLNAFAKREEPKILVHGGGKIATKLAKDMGIETQMIEGRRVTNKKSLDVVTMVYAGLISKNIVAQLQANSCNAVGLCGADGNLIRASKRPTKPIDYGFVGDIDPTSVNTGFLKSLLVQNCCPVLNAINHDGGGQLLNTNADTIASTIAQALSNHYKVKLVLLFDKPGVLTNIEDESSVIPNINSETYPTLLADGVVHQGMIPKIENALKAAEAGVDSVVLSNPDYIIDDTKTGTVIKY